MKEKGNKDKYLEKRKKKKVGVEGKIGAKGKEAYKIRGGNDKKGKKQHQQKK